MSCLCEKKEPEKGNFSGKEGDLRRNEEGIFKKIKKKRGCFLKSVGFRYIMEE